jgi:hypothetical protein
MDGQLGKNGVCMGHMEHGGMALKHSSQNFPCLGGWYVSGLELPRHQNPCRATHWNFNMFGSLGMFWWWVTFWVLPCPSIETCDGGPQKLSCFDDDYVSGGVVFKASKLTPGYPKHMFWWCYAWGSHCLCVKTHAGLSWNKQCICNLSLK